MNMKQCLLVILLLAGSFSQAQEKDENIVVLISLDGCRWDYPQWYDTPFLDFMEKNGAASGLIPAFPSKTFPNHYTLATGLHPEHHGIIGNSFLNRSTGKTFSLGTPEEKYNPVHYGGEPIWLTAQKQGIKTAIFYWPGSDVKIQGKSPELYHEYDKKPRLTYEERINGIVRQLKKSPARRPRLLMAYLEEPDKSGHNYGPQHKNTRKAVEQTDSLLGVLWHKIQALPVAPKVDFIVLSDHGMTQLVPERKIEVMKHLKKEWVEQIEGNMPANIYAKTGFADSIYQSLKTIDHIDVWHRADVPDFLHYKNNPNIGDIVVLPELGWIFCDEEVTSGGMHGYDPSYSDMQAIFRAMGPSFKHIKKKHFNNVSIYPLVCHLLGIAPAPHDGSMEEVKDMLNRAP